MVLCLFELWHSPLREASRVFKELRLGLRLLCCQRVSQSTSKPLPLKFQDFFSPDTPAPTKGYKLWRLVGLGQWWSRSPGVSSFLKPRSLRNNNGSLQVAGVDDGCGAFINRLGRWSDPVAVAKAHAIAA